MVVCCLVAGTALAGAGAAGYAYYKGECPETGGKFCWCYVKKVLRKLNINV